MDGLLHSDELLQKHHLTEGVECDDCKFSLIDDVLGFYFNTEHGQIEDYLICMIDWYSDSPIKGFVHSSYCKNCNRFISTYYIKSLNDEYDMEAAYYLTRLLLPRQLDFVSERLEKYKEIAEKIKSNDLEYLETELKHNRKYFEDYFTGLERVDSFKELIDDDEFDIDEYVEVYEKEFFRLKNTVYLINTGDKNYNLTLDGKQVPEYHCPNCNNAVKEFKFSEYESCPNCGGEHMLFRIGADYD